MLDPARLSSIRFRAKTLKQDAEAMLDLCVEIERLNEEKQRLLHDQIWGRAEQVAKEPDFHRVHTALVTFLLAAPKAASQPHCLDFSTIVDVFACACAVRECYPSTDPSWQAWNMVATKYLEYTRHIDTVSDREGGGA